MSGGELRFSVLGPVRAWRGDTELDAGSPQQRTILAVLLLAEGRQVGLGALQDALWDTQPPSSAASTVRTYVSRLRKSLRAGAGADGLLSRASGYVLPGHPGMLDLKLFEQAAAEAKAARESGEAAGAAALLREALGLCPGTALAGLPGRWADAQRVRSGCALRTCGLPRWKSGCRWTSTWVPMCPRPLTCGNWRSLSRCGSGWLSC
jgi:hypothetical protein